MREIPLSYQRTLSLVASFLASLGCGTIYVYSAYSTQLADRLDLSATETSLIGMTGPLGVSLLASVAGYVVDHYGMLLPCVMGTIGLLLGYSTLYYAYVHSIRIVLLLCLAIGLAGFGSTLTYSACIKTVALNFPQHRGMAVSIPMSAFGLSAFLFSTLAGLAFPGNTAKFLQLLALLTAGLSFLNTPFIKVLRPKHTEVDSENGLATSAETLDASRERQPLVNSPPIQQLSEESEDEDTENSESSSILAEYAHKLVATDVASDPQTAEDTEEEVGGFALLKRLRYWQHFIVLGLMSGSGQMYIYCVGYVVRALMHFGSSEGPDPSQMQSIQALQVAIISISNFSGRLFSGFLSDFVIKKYGYQRLWMVLLAVFFMIVGNISALNIRIEHQIWSVSFLIGFGYGMTFGVYPTIISEAFGMRHFSQNWGLVTISQVISSYLYSYVFGRVFDYNSVSKGDGSDGMICYKGRGCYGKAFQFSLFLNIVTVVHILYVIYSGRQRQLRRINRRMLRLQEQALEGEPLSSTSHAA